MLYLVDASVYIFRAYYTLPDSMTDPDGQPVHAVKGFADFLIRLLNEENVTRLAVCFDESLTTSWRNDIYPDYKATRGLPPPELEAQLGACRDVAAAFGAATYSDARYEADDLIASLLHGDGGFGGDAVIVTSDKDLAQLVTDRVTLLDFAKGKRYAPADVEEKFGVPPEKIVDYLALAGDSVDNIPGVKGVGAKSAVALLTRFRDLDDIYGCLDEVETLDLRGARSLRRKLEADRDSAILSRRLATVSRDAPAERPGPYEGADHALVDPLFVRLGFGSVRERIPRWTKSARI